jgi:hypothetical protein
MLPDIERAERIGEFWSYPQSRTSAELLDSATSLPKGHDAWVVGDEPAIVVDFSGASNYAKEV